MASICSKILSKKAGNQSTPLCNSATNCFCNSFIPLSIADPLHSLLKEQPDLNGPKYISLFNP